MIVKAVSTIDPANEYKLQKEDRLNFQVIQRHGVKITSWEERMG